MKKSILKTLIAILLCLLVTGAVAKVLTGQAQAATKGGHHKIVADHCIDYSEFISSERADKTRFERSMGLTAEDGKVVVYTHRGDHQVVQYPWCGHPASDGYYQVSYDRNKADLLMANSFLKYVLT